MLSKEQIRRNLFCTFSFTLMKEFTWTMRQPSRSTSQRQTVFRRLRKMWRVHALVTMRWWLNGRWKLVYNNLWRCKRNMSGGKRKFQVDFFQWRNFVLFTSQRGSFRLISFRKGILCCLHRKEEVSGWFLPVKEFCVIYIAKRKFQVDFFQWRNFVLFTSQRGSFRLLFAV